MTGAAIVGCGLVGAKRARALAGHRLVVAADRELARAQRLAADVVGCVATTDWEAAVSHPDVDVVIVATSNDALAPIALGSIRRGKHVLVEKPAARSADELAPLLPAARAAGVVVKVGFNHRFHPALQQAKTLVDTGAVGPLLYIRGRYGHGGRPGYDREWRADPVVAGGGELLDQGIHLVDLARWFAGEFDRVWGRVGSFFWNTPVEDNAFVCLETPRGQVAWLHASWTEWKNLFSFEVFGQHGKLHVEGLGGSYGVERLTYYRMRPELGSPDTTAWEYPGEDASWRTEYAYFVERVTTGQPPEGGLPDALAALQLIDRIYAQRRAAEWDAAVSGHPGATTSP